MSRPRILAIRPSLAALLVAVAAFFVRLLHVFSYEPGPTNDMAVYVDMAVRRLSLENLFTPEGLCWFPPGYAIFMKPFFLLAGAGAALRGVQVAQAVLGAWTCFLIYRLGRRIHSRKAGLAAAFLACFFPHYIFYTSVYLSETLFTALFLAALLLFIRAAARPRTRTWFLAGLLAAACALVRPAAATLAPAAVLSIWRSAPDRRGRLRAAGLILAGAIALVGPWAARNLIAYDRFVLVSTNGPFNLAIGNHADARGGYVSPPSISSDIWGRAEYFKQRAIGFVTNDPWGALYLIFKLKWMELWSFIPPWPLFSSNPTLFYGEHFFVYFPWRAILPLGLIGIGALALRRRPAWWLTPACLGCYVAFYMAFFGDTRFRLPAEAFFLVWSGCALAETAGRWLPLRRVRAPSWAGAVTLATGLILAEGGLFGASARAFQASENSFIAKAGQVPIITNQESIQVFGEEPLPVSRARGRFLRLEFLAYRQGPKRNTPDNGRVRLLFMDGAGRTRQWMDNTGYRLEALPADRWVPVGFKAHIPPWAASLRLEVLPDPESPDSVILDQFTLRYARANSLAGEELFPYLRYEE